MMQLLERQVARIFIAAMGTIAIGIMVASYHTVQREREERLVAHTNDLIGELEKTLSNLNEAEANELEFALTGRTASREPFERAGALATQHLSNARVLLADDPVKRRRLDGVEGSMGRELLGMKAVMEARRVGGLDAAARASLAGADETRIETIRDSVRALERDEQRALAVRRRALDAAAHHTAWAVRGLGIASLAMLWLAFTTARGARRRQRVAEQAMYEVNAELKARHDELLLRGRESTGLERLGDALQLCLTSEEAYGAIAKCMEELLPGTTTGGVLALFRGSRDHLESVATWGVLAGRGDAGFAKDECCALRGGRTYSVAKDEARLRCAHVAEEGAYVCIPLAAHGEAIGVLHVLSPGNPDMATAGVEMVDPARYAAMLHDQTVTASGRWPAADYMGWLRRASENIAVSLANLTLRERLRAQSIHDPLTGAFNRRYLDEALEREVRRARRHGRGLSFVMLDIDHFKRVNDEHGHEAGDDILRGVADLLRRAVRDIDIVCRYGGEEFAILLPETSSDVALARTEAILQTCRERQFPIRGGVPGRITISAGIAAQVHPSESWGSVVQRADAALYEAKRQGRDRSVRADQAGVTLGNADEGADGSGTYAAQASRLPHARD